MVRGRSGCGQQNHFLSVSATGPAPVAGRGHTAAPGPTRSRVNEIQSDTWQFRREYVRRLIAGGGARRPVQETSREAERLVSGWHRARLAERLERRALNGSSPRPAAVTTQVVVWMRAVIATETGRVQRPGLPEGRVVRSRARRRFGRPRRSVSVRSERDDANRPRRLHRSKRTGEPHRLPGAPAVNVSRRGPRQRAPSRNLYAPGAILNAALATQHNAGSRGQGVSLRVCKG